MIRWSTWILFGLAHASFAAGVQSPACDPWLKVSPRPPIQDLSGKLPVPDYLDGVTRCLGAQMLQMPASAWLDGDAARYAAMLGRSQYEWLVLPPQTQFYGFDLAERMLIGAEIAAALSDRGTMPDITLVARALGESRRRFLDVSSLTAAIGARRRVETYVGHDGQHHLTLTVQLMDCSTGSDCRLLKQKDWRNLPFSDDLPPFRVIGALRAQIRSEIGGASATSAAAGTIVAAPAIYPFSPTELMQPTATVDPRTASLLAALMPSAGSFGRDRLHVAALQAWVNAAPTADSRFFAAYAALELQRRPYGLQLLQKQNDPAAAALRELLNGNLPDARQKASAVRDPLQRFLLELGVHELAAVYDYPLEFDPRLTKALFGPKLSDWQPLVDRRVADIHPDLERNPWLAKSLLDRAVPIAKYNLQNINSESASDVGVANFRHLREALGSLRPGECCAFQSRGSGRWMMYWLIEGMAEADAVRAVAWLRYNMGSPARALPVIQKYDAYLTGFPPFEWERAATLSGLSRKASDDEAGKYSDDIQKSMLLAAFWSQGQTFESSQIVFDGNWMLYLSDPYSRDFPRRSYWPNPNWELAKGEDKGACDGLQYGTFDLDAAERCLTETPASDRPALAAQLQSRFRGAPGRSKLLAAVSVPASAAVASGSSSLADRSEETRLRTDIKQAPELWDNYYALGNLLIERQGAFAEAQQVFLSYPPFRRASGVNPITLSNDSYSAGSRLFWRGKPELARPLFVIAANLQTGSEGSLSSAARLAQLDGDFEATMELLGERAERYGNPYAYRDLISFLHATGHAEDARRGFLQVAELSSYPQTWQAAQVDQRMTGKSWEEVKAWLMSSGIRDAHFRGTRFAPYYALSWATTDRIPPADLPQFMQQLEQYADRQVIAGGVLLRPHPAVDGGQQLRPSALRKGKAPALVAGTRVKSEFVLVADALTALHSGQFADAVDKFVALADRYPIELDEFKSTLPYFALAVAKSTDTIGLQAFIEARADADKDFDVWLSRAFFAAGRHDSDKAAIALTRAYNVRPQTDVRLIDTEYQYAEACEIVARETRDPRFTAMLLDWARVHQRLVPTQAWAYAIEAQYSGVPAEANRALAMALYLDPKSPRLQKIDAARMNGARAWLAKNNPFLQPKVQTRGAQVLSPASPAT